MFDAFINNLPLIWLIGLLVFSLWAVVKSADTFVDGAASLSLYIGLPAFVVGLTIVAVGTSSPELVVNSIAAAKGETQLSVGNILGSNFANILLALGIAAIFRPLSVHSRTVWKEFPFMLLSSLLILILGADVYLDGASSGVISRSDALVLLSFFVIFIVYTFGLNKNIVDTEEKDKIKKLPLANSVLYTIAGLAGLIVSGDVLVSSATTLAEKLEVSKNLIGLTVVAVGTSLPEIVTSVLAARKGFVDMLVGGIVGSNIFNAFLILGVTALIHPIEFTHENLTDAITLSLVSLLLFLVMFSGKRHTLDRSYGVLFVLIYVVYIIAAILRG